MRVEEPQLEPLSTETAPGVVVRRNWQKHLLTFLMVFGPGLIVMEADNDAGAVSTYMQAGGQYGLHLLWLLAVQIRRGVHRLTKELECGIGDFIRASITATPNPSSGTKPQTRSSTP